MGKGVLNDIMNCLKYNYNNIHIHINNYRTINNIFLTTTIYIYNNKSNRTLTHSSYLYLRKKTSSTSYLSFSYFSSISFFKRTSSSYLFISSNSSNIKPKNKTKYSLKIYLQHLKNSFKIYLNFLKYIYSTSINNSHNK